MGAKTLGLDEGILRKKSRSKEASTDRTWIIYLNPKVYMPIKSEVKTVLNARATRLLIKGERCDNFLIGLEFVSSGNDVKSCHQEIDLLLARLQCRGYRFRMPNVEICNIWDSYVQMTVAMGKMGEVRCVVCWGLSSNSTIYKSQHGEPFNSDGPRVILKREIVQLCKETNKITKFRKSRPRGAISKGAVTILEGMAPIVICRKTRPLRGTTWAAPCCTLATVELYSRGSQTESANQIIFHEDERLLAKWLAVESRKSIRVTSHRCATQAEFDAFFSLTSLSRYRYLVRIQDHRSLSCADSIVSTWSRPLWRP